MISRKRSRDKFTRAWELIEQVGWCQGAYALDEEGRPGGALSLKPTAYCTVGALCAIYAHDRPTYYQNYDKLQSELGNIITWNDDRKRTKDEVISVLKGLDL